MAKQIKVELNELQSVNTTILELIKHLEVLKTETKEPDLFEYIVYNSVDNLENENNKLKNKIKKYDAAVSQILTKVSNIINILEKNEE